MREFIPLCLLRIWCRKNNCWLSFKTTTGDRYLVNPSGYFSELPDGSLTEISPRLTFPVINYFPAVPLNLLSPRLQYGEDAKFIAIPLVVPQHSSPVCIDIVKLQQDPLAQTTLPPDLSQIERYILLRALEAGLVSPSGFSKLFELRQRYKTVGTALVKSNCCSWESLLLHCLDVRSASTLDPPSLQTVIEHKEWELIGEILCRLGHINRTQLEYGLKVKRESGQALGKILTAMGACSQEEIDKYLKIQSEIKLPQGQEVALIGTLLVSQGIISEQDLEEALRHQHIARQPLSKVLLCMGACTQSDIDGYERNFGTNFQSEIDDMGLANYLIKTDTITMRDFEEALRLQQRGRQVLGELLVSMGLCSTTDIEKIIQFQREIRETHHSGIEKLGALLIHSKVVLPAKVDQAIQLQAMGRQPFGALLAAQGACTAENANEAHQIQQLWRDQDRTNGDRLGEILVQQQILSRDQLEECLSQHIREQKPLGRILIENDTCSPEQIIESLIIRDQKRHQSFLDFMHDCINSNHKNQETSDTQDDFGNKKKSLAGKLSSWFSK